MMSRNSSRNGGVSSRKIKFSEVFCGIKSPAERSTMKSENSVWITTRRKFYELGITFANAEASQQLQHMQ